MLKIVAECYFLDVGQGVSQVINLGDDSAIVIDCGPSYQVLGDLLRRRLGIKRIAALVLSHNHRDHIGGVSGLVRQYRNSIDRIYLLQDQTAGGMLRQFWYLRSEIANGDLPAPIPLIRHDENKWLYQGSGAADSIRLELLFPTFFENIDGQASGNQNYTCGVLLLRCGSKRILFPGDAEIATWRAINKTRENRPVECDVMAIPHHGGQIVRYRKKNETYEELHRAIAADLDWLYTQAIKSATAIISVGTSNTYPDQHPLPPQIDAVRKSGARVICTQITNRCSDDLERLRPGVLDPMTTPCQSRPATPITSSDQSKDVACAGTVVVQIGPNELRIERQDDHQTGIDAKLISSADHPLCRG